MNATNVCQDTDVWEGMSEKGYSSQVIGKQWMQTVFDPQIKDIADGHTCLLKICPKGFYELLMG